MNVMGMDLNQIVDLTTQVATSGALRATEFVSDEIWGMIIGIAILVYETDPGFL